MTSKKYKELSLKEFDNNDPSLQYVPQRLSRCERAET